MIVKIIIETKTCNINNKWIYNNIKNLLKF